MISVNRHYFRVFLNYFCPPQVKKRQIFLHLHTWAIAKTIAITCRTLGSYMGQCLSLVFWEDASGSLILPSKRDPFVVFASALLISMGLCLCGCHRNIRHGACGAWRACTCSCRNALTSWSGSTRGRRRRSPTTGATTTPTRTQRKNYTVWVWGRGETHTRTASSVTWFPHVLKVKIKVLFTSQHIKSNFALDCLSSPLTFPASCSACRKWG